MHNNNNGNNSNNNNDNNNDNNNNIMMMMIIMITIIIIIIIIIVVGALDAILKQFGNRLKQIGITAGTAQVQETVLLGTAKILRNVLEIYG